MMAMLDTVCRQQVTKDAFSSRHEGLRMSRRHEEVQGSETRLTLEAWQDSDGWDLGGLNLAPQLMYSVSLLAET